jgi:hypothetical protein
LRMLALLNRMAVSRKPRALSILFPGNQQG